MSPMPTEEVANFIIRLLSPAMHKKRALSLAQAAVGTMHAQRLSVSDVGRALGRAYGTIGKHGIKQVDRLLSNKSISMDQVFSRSVPWLVGQRRRIVVSLDWRPNTTVDFKVVVASAARGIYPFTLEIHAHDFPRFPCGTVTVHIEFRKTGRDPWGDEESLENCIGIWQPDDFDFRPSQRLFKDTSRDNLDHSFEVF